ncbi:B12-binding domain/radical SAM domain-containing protein [Paraburkholderia kururiensis]|uniref:B12-binding domain/radical SAM domain-containing protein n=1 Tax=Paraburkholderia kururiensis TaxID=984307 RepID=UPI000AFB5ABA|nr:B12-binding domain/radical SAM domain-containing protein [Paraburkholderia kururiensis]
MSSLRVLAVAAPESVTGARGELTLSSRDPASLYNACRLAAARTEIASSAWATSNWCGRRSARRDKCVLMHSGDEMPRFEALLRKERPNLVLIGAMTICMRGAIECAMLVRRVMGADALVVLGGRHACETLYLADASLRHVSQVRHHPASALSLMVDRKIEHVFDLVVSGDGEYLIAELGELVARASGNLPAQASDFVRALPEPATRGDWIAGCVHECSIYARVSSGLPLDYNELPSPVRVFGLSSSFDVFDGRLTAHVSSDMGRGCIYSCAFCSESSAVTGSPRDLRNSADRLFRQLSDTVTVVREDHPLLQASAFVEDSVMLGGSAGQLERLAHRLECAPLDIHWGAQLTIDLIIARKQELLRLRRSGLRYLFVGIETLIPAEIGGMSKDTRSRRRWLDRIEDALSFLRDADIKCGCAVLFGLGESPENRRALLDELVRMRSIYGGPHPISFNWAVQHPLRGSDDSKGYDYLDWPTPKGELLELFRHFGEASARYPLHDVGTPRIDEVREVVTRMKHFAHDPRTSVWPSYESNPSETLQ